MRKINEFLYAEDIDEKGNGAIFPDTEQGKELGFTSDKYSSASYLYRKDNTMTISFIETVTPGKGHFSQLLNNLKKSGYNIQVPTPSNLMREILIKKHFKPIVDESDFGSCEIWMKKKMLKETKRKEFANGVVYALQTEDNYPIEVTDTFLPYYTKDAIGRKQNCLMNNDLGSRKERWMIGVSCMSGCPVGCKFCAAGKLKKWRNLAHHEILKQFIYVLDEQKENFESAQEHKINFTRLGEPFLNLENVKVAIEALSNCFPKVHHYVSTIGIKDSDFSWIKDNITLQISLHSLKEDRRNWLIPYKNKMTIKELGQIRTKSNLKTTLNLTLVNQEDFDINVLRENFDPEYFFVKLSPINKNEISENNNLGEGIIKGINII